MPKYKSDPGKECCGGHCHEALDARQLGPEAAELAKMFNSVNDSLVAALEMRHRILDTIHRNSAKSAELKEKMDKVVGAQHPVLVQFVFGDGASSCGKHEH